MIKTDKDFEDKPESVGDLPQISKLGIRTARVIPETKYLVKTPRYI